MNRLVDATGYYVSCTSQAALEWFNKGLISFVTLNGTDSMSLLEKALEVDPDFVMVHCILGLFGLDELKPPNHPNVAGHLQAVEKALKNKCFNEREGAYIKAVQIYASGDLIKATDEFMTLLQDYSLDFLALRFVAGNTINTGEYEKCRDTLAWCLAFWNDGMEFYPYVLSFYGFALEQTNERIKAEKLLDKTLKMNSKVPWAIHGMAHVIEESHDPSDGVEFLTQTRRNWEDSVFGGHLTWHLTLYYFDIGDTDSVFSVYDNVLSKYVSPDNIFDGLLDATSLLWRLNVMGIDPGEKRWSKVIEAVTENIHNHRSPWFDAHVMMGLAHGNLKQTAARLALAEELLQSMKKYSKTDSVINCNQDLSDKVGVPVCTALLAFGQEKYDDVLQIMLPLRHNLRQLGGSWAQRQVFIITLIQAAVKAKKKAIAKGLIAELKGMKPQSRRLEEILKNLNKQDALP